MLLRVAADAAAAGGRVNYDVGRLLCLYMRGTDLHGCEPTDLHCYVSPGVLDPL
jgi:hypothetical protein